MAVSQFAFIAGSLSLSFVDTQGPLGDAGVERLIDPCSLTAWLSEAGLATTTERFSEEDVEKARDLRDAIRHAARTAMAGLTHAENDIVRINAAAIEPPLRPQLTPTGAILVAASPLDAALSVIAAEAIAMLGQRERIRECPECRMLFLDTSRPGQRRWCSSSSGCGNRAKVRNHRARRAHSKGE